jgi:hypothetical protein
MMRMCFTLLMLGLLMGTAVADHIVTMESKDLDTDPPTVTEIQLYMTPDNLKIVDPAQSSVMIYKSKEDAVYMVDESNKQYVIMNRESMAQMNEQMAGMMKQMEEALAELPEDQREMAKQMMKGKMPQGTTAKAPVMEVKRVGKTMKVADKPCERYDILKDGVKTTEIWAVPWKMFEVSEKEFAVFKKMASFMKELISASAFADKAQDGYFAGIDEIDGFPMLVRQLEGEKVTEETTTKSVKKTKLDATEFDISEDYKQHDPMAGMKK